MDEKQQLEKWLRQIQSGQIKPDAIGLGKDKDKAVEQIRKELNKLSQNKSVLKR